MLQKLSCILLTLLLLLGSSGCGKKDVSASKNLVSVEEKATPADDKFFLLQEASSFLSSDGAPLCVEEYWGGQELDLRNLGENFLLATRDTQNQMHYFFCDPTSHTFSEIDIANKRIF